MKSLKINFYFVLYLIAVVSGFVAITERDEEKINTRKIRDLLKKEYTTIPHIIVNEDQHFALTKKEEIDTIRISQSGLLSHEDTVQYFCTSVSAAASTRRQPLEVVLNPAVPGDGVLPILLSGNMRDSILITLKVRRIVPLTYPPDVRVEIQKCVDSVNGGWFITQKTIVVRADFTAKPKPLINGTGTSSE